MEIEINQEFWETLFKCNYDKAISDLSKVINNKTDLFCRAIDYLGKHDFDKAIADFEALALYYPNNEQWQQDTKRVREILGQQKVEYEKELMGCSFNEFKTKPDAHEIINKKGLAFAEKKEYVDAITCYNLALDIKPDFYETMNNCGIVYLCIGQTSAAVLSFTNALEIKPDFYAALFNRGVAYLEDYNTDKAIADFTEVINKNPNHYNAFRCRGLTYEKEGEYEKAIADWEAALKINPQDAETKKNIEELRFLLYWQEEYEEYL